MPKMRSASERFNEKIDCSGGPDACWMWNGYRMPFGHGMFSQIPHDGQSRTVLAHRFAWEQAHGLVPDGLCVLHRCDVPSCVNPAHLFLGTKSENSRDMVTKNRQSRGEARPASKLDAESVLTIRREAANGVARSLLASRFGVSDKTVGRIVRREGWRHL